MSYSTYAERCAADGVTPFSEAAWASLADATERSRGQAGLAPSSVNPALTPSGAPDEAPTDTPPRPPRRRSRAARVIEPADFAAMMRRMIAAHGRRVADADVEDLAELIALRDELDEAIAYAVRESRNRWERSWADIGRAAGISRQAAEQRWGAKR